MKNEFAIDTVKNKIHTIRGLQVMLDSDLAELYDVKTGRLNEQVKRNIERFPKEFMFQITENEVENWKSQIVISSNNSLRSQNAILKNKFQNLKSQFATSSSNWGGTRKSPYVFTEQGVAMLSGVLRSDIAVKVSIQIMNAFVSMRKFIASNAQLFSRLDSVEQKQLEHDNKFEQVFRLIEDKDIKPERGIFFDGQMFDAYKFVSDLVKSAKKSIVLIDNYVDESVLVLFSKRSKDVSVVIHTKLNEQLKLDLKRFNSQYSSIVIKYFDKSHDRFMIVDNDVYHIGASLKDLGKKWFAFSKFEKNALKLLDKLN